MAGATILGPTHFRGVDSSAGSFPPCAFHGGFALLLLFVLPASLSGPCDARHNSARQYSPNLHLFSSTSEHKQTTEVKMPGLRKNQNSTVAWSFWEGDPDSDAAHHTVLQWLQSVATSGFQQPTQSLSPAVKGNLGEFTAYEIGHNYVFTNGEIAYGANTADPLSPKSQDGIDIVWLYFGIGEADDWAGLQEVKTTSDPSLALANDLIDDYDKLFGENVRQTLQTRLTALKNKLDQRGQGHLSSRLTSLTGPAPDQARGIRLYPTLFHDAAHNSSTKMTTIHQVLVGLGWSAAAVECWSVALDSLDNRLTRLARGQP